MVQENELTKKVARILDEAAAASTLRNYQRVRTGSLIFVVATFLLVGSTVSYWAADQLSTISKQEYVVLDHLAVAQAVLTRTPKKLVIADLERRLNTRSVNRIKRHQLDDARAVLTDLRPI